MKTSGKEHKNCPICGGSHKHLYDIKHPAYPFSTSQCTLCGFIFMNPPFSDKTISDFYNDAYYSGSSSFSYIDERKNEKYSRHTWDARLTSIKKFVPGGNFLDVGCSFGGFLSRAEKKGFKPYGVELSDYSGSYAKKRFGKNIHIGTLENSDFPDGFFSVITMIEVIEHLTDPLKTLKICRKKLADGGMILIQTADMNGLQAIEEGESYHYFLPGHLSYFSEQSLKQSLAEAGFSSTRIFRPVDFGLMPKLLKSRGSFNKIADYLKWIDITKYHLKGKFTRGGHPLTSSMVMYGFV